MKKQFAVNLKQVVDYLLLYEPLVLLLAVAPLAFLRSGGDFANNPKMALLQWGIGLLAVMALLRHRNLSSFTWRVCLLDAAVLLFLLWAGQSLLWAGNADYGVVPLLQIFAGSVWYCYLRLMLKRPQMVARLFVVAGLSGGLVGLLGLGQQFLGWSWIPQLLPPASTFANCNMASHFAALYMKQGDADKARAVLLPPAAAGR